MKLSVPINIHVWPFAPDNPCQGNQHMNSSLKLSIQMFALLCPIQK
jgi:hypothetical protein